MVGSTWSPDSTTPSAGSNRQRWSSVWPGRVQRHPLAPGEGDDLRVLEPARRARHLHVGAHLLAVRSVIISSWLPQSRSPPHGSGPVPRARRRQSLWSSVAVSGSSASISLRVPPDAEALVGDDVGARLLADARRAAEVVGVRVGDDHGVHPRQRDAGGAEAGDERRPTAPGRAGRDRRRPRPARPRGRSSSRDRARAW